MKEILAVGGGGFLGAILRYQASILVEASLGKPWGTLGVNVVGCFAIGLLSVFFEAYRWPVNVHLFLTTGILGALTTFSTYSLETVMLAREGRWLHAALYSLGSLALGLLSVLLGRFLAKVLGLGGASL